MSIDPSAPVIVACAQQTWREPDVRRGPIDALAHVGFAALEDAGSAPLRRVIDSVATVRFITDSDPNTAPLMPRNPGRSVARELGLGDVACYHTDLGGNTPQWLLNQFAARLAAGEARAVLVCGAELLNTFFAALREGLDISAWPGDEAGQAILLGEEKAPVSDAERCHGLYEPVNVYPLFENALRHSLQRGAAEHQQALGQLCARMAAVAAENPLAWSRTAMAPEQIASTDDGNRYIGYPYTRAMNARLAVDMAAAVVLTTVGTAMELGIDADQMVFLRAGAEVNDIWHPAQRPELARAPGIGVAVHDSLQRAGLALGEIDRFDIYSCFPSAVEIACNEIGLDPLDPRGVTVTGGLPYFGGPGNNYSLHAVAEVCRQLREGHGRHALVTANGLYLTKHAVGVYSSEPPPAPWQAPNSHALQSLIDREPGRPMAADAAGDATLVSYTVAFDRAGPSLGIAVLENAAGERILANSRDEDQLAKLLDGDPVGRQARVTASESVNLFEL